MNLLGHKHLLLSGGSIILPWDVSTSNINNLKSETVPSSSNFYTGMYFKPDGLILYLVCHAYDCVYQYNLSTAWDIATLNTTPVKAFDYSANMGFGSGISFKPDGAKMYLSTTNDLNGWIGEWDLSTPWDISTAIYKQRYSNSILYYTGYIDLVKSGTKLYVGGNSGLFEYSLSVAYNLATASFVRSASYSGGPFRLKPDGTRMISVNPGVNLMKSNSYELTTPWDIGTLSLVSEANLGSSAITDFSYGLYVKDDGEYVFTMGNKYNKIVRNTLKVPSV